MTKGPIELTSLLYIIIVIIIIIIIIIIINIVIFNISVRSSCKRPTRKFENVIVTRAGRLREWALVTDPMVKQ